MNRPGKKMLLASLFSLVSLVAVQQARAITFVDNFDNNLINPVWWTAGATGDSTINAVNGRIEMTQGASGYAAMSFALPITGDFTATIDYTLLNWPANNLERLGLNGYAGQNKQLAMERVSDKYYDTTGVGEIYVTDFTGQGILGTPTSDVSGTLSLQRIGDIVRGSYWTGSAWNVIGTYSVLGENNVERIIGMGIWAGTSTTPGVKVAVDNFTLNAPSVPVPEPESYALLLSGIALLMFRLGKR